MKHIKEYSLFKKSLNEAKRSTVHRAAKKGSYPAVIVVVQDGKVIHQEPVSTPDVAPATFNVMQNKYPKALLHLEDKTGKRLFSESVVNERLARGLKPLLKTGSTITKKVGEDALLDLSDKFDSIDDEYAGTIASHLDMAIELMQDGYPGDATKKLKQFNKACKDVLNGKEVGSAFESTITEGTYNSKNHIGSTSDGQGSNAEIYKKGKGYYVVVSGEADYDFDAKNDKELLKKLKDNEFDSTDILEVNESKEDFKPHMMYDPKTGKGYKAETQEDHERMNKLGYVHEKPEEVTEAMDINDPVLMAFRATRRELPKFKPAKAKSRRLSFDKYMDLLDDQTNIEQDIKDYAEEMAQTFRDMEQEAEPEGGEMADKYGSIMMKQEKEYAKLKAKKAKIDARIEKHRMD